MPPQINSQGLLSDLPHLHVVTCCNMAAGMAELEIRHFSRTKVWEYFRFYQVKEGPKTKENLDMMKVICRLCRKQQAKKVCGTYVLLILRQSHLNFCNVILNLIKNMSLTGCIFCLKHSLGCFREKLLVDETMTCQFMLCYVVTQRYSQVYSPNHSTVTHF